MTTDKNNFSDIFSLIKESYETSYEDLSSLLNISISSGKISSGKSSDILPSIVEEFEFAKEHLIKCKTHIDVALYMVKELAGVK